MKESYSYRPIRDEIEKKRDSTGAKPLTAGEHDSPANEPMSLTDNWLSLNTVVHEKMEIQKPSLEQQEKLKPLHELISPELAKGYLEILKELDSKTKVTKEHLHREFVDINDKKSSEQIENWINALVQEIESQKKAKLPEGEQEEVRANCWLLFNSLGNVLSAKSVENDIADFYKKNGSLEKPRTEKESKKELIAELQEHYPLNKEELEILVDLISVGENDEVKYSPKILVETIGKLWKEHELGKKKRKIAQISLGYLMAQGVESFSPYLFQNILAPDRFRTEVFLEYFALGKISERINSRTEIELAKVMNEIHQQINERIANSLFFQEFEFIHEKSLGDIYETLERGKNATEQILQDTISRFAPTLAGIAMSLAFLTKINPALGAIGVGSLPFMYRVAKEQNEKIWPLYEQIKEERSKTKTDINAMKAGFEEIKTTSEVPEAALAMKQQMDKMDKLELKKFIEETKMRLKQMVPFDVATVVAAGVGEALQRAEMISGGAVLSTIIYSSQLNRPVKELVNLYFNRFVRYVQDVKKMEEIFGQYDKLDLPEGEKEKNRVPVSELPNFDISIKNLQYKNILRGIDLEIKQGEFVTIAGASGLGKSTLLRNIVGLYKADAGVVEIGEHRNDQIKKYGPESLYSVMSFCNDTPQIFESMTLRENLKLWSKKEVSDEKIIEVMKDLRLNKFIGHLDQKIKHFSKGERVRIGVARTLIKDAKVMLLDEPTASLDSSSAAEVRKILTELNTKYPDTTIVCVSHDKDLIETSKRVVNLEELQK